MDHQSIIAPWDLECLLCDETAEPQALPLSLLKKITDSFSDEQEIGRGGFAIVYKGRLENRTVAVKKSTTYMHEKEFQREVACLMMVKHKNIIRFLGYCSDTQGTMARDKGKFIMADVQQRLLCFEYLPKGSLHEYITDDRSSGLQWSDRYQIIKGICHGLHYLHKINIVHLDLKPANVLLDNNFVAKIADFGLSRCLAEMERRIKTTKIGGTLGYLAPEFGNGEITYKFDIYSLGVIILEILTGKKGYQDVDKVVESWSNKLENSHIEVQQEQVRVCAEIGIECTNFNPSKRPDTQHIISRLNETESTDEYVQTVVLTSDHVAESRSRSLEKSRRELQEEQVGVDKTKTMDAYVETGVITSQQLVQEDFVFTVKDEPWFKLKQLRDLNNLHGSLVIDGLENVKSGEEALEANLAAKERLTELVLQWDYSSAPCPEVQAQVLEGLCPHVSLKKLKIRCYEGSRYPDWMVGKQNGGPNNLQELDLHTFVNGPAPQIVEAFPHLRVLELSCGSWEALPSNMEHLTSLKKLVLNRNYIIRSLPTLPRSLEEFHAIYCDHIFMKSCVKVGHPNWHQIEHIPKKTFKDDPIKTIIVLCCPVLFFFHFVSVDDILLLTQLMFGLLWIPQL